jgi:hypothetical protein
MSSEKKYFDGKRRSFFGPILLITIGLIFLGNNLGLIPGEGWETIWRLWPVLFIIAGLNDLVRRQGIAWPILLIGAGVFLLLNNFGPQVWISWTQLIQLWPILLIAAGIDLVFKGDSIWYTIGGVILTLMLIGGSVWIVRSGFQVAADYTEIREIFSDEVEQMDLDLSLGAGELILGSDTPDGVLVFGSLTPDKYIDQISTKAGKIIYELEHSEPGFYPHTARWELDLTDDLVADLAVNNGAGEMILSLEAMNLVSLDVKQGVGRMVVHLPEMDSDQVLISQAVGTIQIQIPKNTQVAVDAKNGLSKVDFPADFELEDGYYVSPGASRSNAELFIIVEQAIGLINIQYAR